MITKEEVLSRTRRRTRGNNSFTMIADALTSTIGGMDSLVFSKLSRFQEILYLAGKINSDWFNIDRQDLANDLKISIATLERSLVRLKEEELLQIEVHGCPPLAYYKINDEALDIHMLDDCHGIMKRRIAAYKAPHPPKLSTYDDEDLPSLQFPQNEGIDSSKMREPLKIRESIRVREIKTSPKGEESRTAPVGADTTKAAPVFGCIVSSRKRTSEEGEVNTKTFQEELQLELASKREDEMYDALDKAGKPSKWQQQIMDAWTNCRGMINSKPVYLKRVKDKNGDEIGPRWKISKSYQNLLKFTNRLKKGTMFEKTTIDEEWAKNNSISPRLLSKAWTETEILDAIDAFCDWQKKGGRAPKLCLASFFYDEQFNTSFFLQTIEGNLKTRNDINNKSFFEKMDEEDIPKYDALSKAIDSVRHGKWTDDFADLSISENKAIQTMIDALYDLVNENDAVRIDVQGIIDRYLCPKIVSQGKNPDFSAHFIKVGSKMWRNMVEELASNYGTNLDAYKE